MRGVRGYTLHSRFSACDAHVRLTQVGCAVLSMALAATLTLGPSVITPRILLSSSPHTASKNSSCTCAERGLEGARKEAQRLVHLCQERGVLLARVTRKALDAVEHKATIGEQNAAVDQRSPLLTVL